MSPTLEEDLSALVSRIASGDGEAVAWLYDATRRKVYGLVRRIVRDLETAEEVVLDVYTQAWRQATSYDPSRGAVVAWLLTLARTRAIDALRSRVRRVGNGIPLSSVPDVADPTPGPEQRSVGSERAVRVRRALSQLPREQREAIEAAFFGGLSHSEVAKAIGTPLGTVKTRIRTGLSTLRRALDSPEENVA